eukprot:scaffold243_cov265-Alexandrium_tamarense.AAC.10
MKIRISRLEREERVGVEARMSSRLAVRSWSSRKCTYVVIFSLFGGTALFAPPTQLFVTAP